MKTWQEMVASDTCDYDALIDSRKNATNSRKRLHRTVHLAKQKSTFAGEIVASNFESNTLHRSAHRKLVAKWTGER